MKRHAKFPILRQPPVAGGRHALAACVLPEIEARLQAVADHFGVSRSWVVATELAHVLGTATDQPNYRTAKAKRRKGVGRA